MSEAIGKLLSAQPRSAALQPGRRNRSIGTPGAPNRPLQHFSSEREEQVPTDRRPGRRGYKSEASTSHHAALLQRSAGTGTETKQKAAPPERMLPLVLPVRKEKRTPAHTWTALERALRSIDLLLQGGGFRAIVLDLGSTPAEMAWRIPLATWFRFRSASERSRISFVLLSRHACARSSAELVLQMQPGEFLHQGAVMTGMQYRSSVERQRQHRPAGNVIPMRKPPQGDRTRAGVWQCGTTWAHAQ